MPLSNATSSPPAPRLLDRMSRHQATPWVLLGVSLLTCLLGWYHGEPTVVVIGAVATNLVLAVLLFLQRVAGAQAERLAARQSVELQRSEAAFQAVAESARVAIVTTDASGRFLYANATAERMLHASREQLRGVDSVNFVAEGDRARLARGLRKFLAGEGRIAAGHPIPLRGRRQSGEEFPAEISLSWVEVPDGRVITGVIVDLSDRQRVEAEARVAEARWKVALESTDDGVWDWDVGRGVMHGSRRLYELFGLSPTAQGLTYTDWTAVVHPADRTRMQAALDAHLAGETERYASEYRVCWPDGQVRWLLARGRLIDRDAGGRPLRLVGTCTDITDRQEAQQTLEFAREQAEQAARSKSDFLAMMSHELRTPMNGVLGMANLLGSTPLTAEQREYLDMIGRSGHALLRLIDDILDFSKIEAGRVVLEQVPCDLAAIVGEVITMLRVPAQTRGLTLDSVVVPGTPTGVVSDPGRLRQVLFNLVGNAIKFTEIGSVHVRVGCDGVHAGRTTLRIVVEDTGIGIPDDKQQVLFEKFTQADASTTRRFGGTGLGLAISKGLVEGLGGSIGVSSRVGVGSQFWFTITAPMAVDLPLPQPSAPLVAPNQEPDRGALPARNDGPRVLVAEDNPVNQRVAVRMLEKLGFAADVAPDGLEAVRMVSASSYVAVLMDCHMPNMDGFEATRVIRSTVPMGQRPPILALTAAGAGHDRERCLAVGMDDYLKKPVQLHELRSMLARWVSSIRTDRAEFPHGT
jgi:PAS domain S-box-containing protein